MDDKALSEKDVNDLLREVETPESEGPGALGDIGSIADDILDSSIEEGLGAKPQEAEAASPTEASANPIQEMQESAPAPGQAKVQEIILPNIQAQGDIRMETKEGTNMNLLMDVQMNLTVELGRTKMFIKEVLGLGEGSIIELDKLAGEPVDLLVNGKLVAKGEVVVIDENFGVRVTDIVSPIDRVKDQFEEK